MSPLAWDLVIPVKRLARAKSRLTGFEDADRQRLALSFATDAVAAARAATRVARVLVVTDDALAAAELALHGAAIVGEARGPGLNRAVEAGIDAVLADDPLGRVAAMTGDLPAVTSAEIDAALALAEARTRTVLADADGTGTVLLTANPWTESSGVRTPKRHGPDRSHETSRPGASVRPFPRFGAGSFARHVAAGHVPLTGAHPGLRRDVDTRADLEAARGLGLGVTTQLDLLSGGPPVLRERSRPVPSAR